MASAYDVIVVGAGPAGGAAAYHAAAGGLSVLLVDRKPFPRTKVCGDGLTPRALRALARMHLSVAEGRPRIEGIRFVRGRETGLLRFSDEPPPFRFGTVVPRLELDDRIRRRAEAAGAEFRDGTVATALAFDRSGAVAGVWLSSGTGSRRYAAPLTILADGAHGRLTRKLVDAGTLFHPFRGVALRQYVAGVGDLGPYFEIHSVATATGALLEGYAWIFPVAPGMANVGLGILNRTRPREPQTLSAMFSAFLEDLAARDARFASVAPAGPLEGGTLATSMVDLFGLPNGVLCIGDAAGLVNPFTGEGIGTALESGEVAAATAVRILSEPRGLSPSSRYARSLVRAYGRQWRLRASPRHLGWLLSLPLPASGTEPDKPLVSALRALALDQAPPVFPEFVDLVARLDPPAERLIRVVRKQITVRLRRTDMVLAELGHVLCVPEQSPVLWPLIIAVHAFGGPLADPHVRRGVLALSLSSLAAALLEAARDAPDGEAENALAIVAGDCVLTEATAVASGLPPRRYRRVVAASCAMSRALLGRSTATSTFLGFRGQLRPIAEAMVQLMLDEPEDGARTAIVQVAGACADAVELLFQKASEVDADIARRLWTDLEIARTNPDLPPSIVVLAGHVGRAGRGRFAQLVAHDRSA